MKKNEVKIKQTLDFEAVKTILESLVKSFGEKTVVVESGNDFVTLSPDDDINLELSAGGKKNKEKLTIELSWKKSLPCDVVPAPELKISSKEPEMAPPVEANTDKIEADTDENTDL